MDDIGLRAALDEVTFASVRCDDVAGRVRYADLLREADTGEGVAEVFSATRLLELIALLLVLKELADISEDRTRDQDVAINRHRITHELFDLLRAV